MEDVLQSADSLHMAELDSGEVSAKERVWLALVIVGLPTVSYFAGTSAGGSLAFALIILPIVCAGVADFIDRRFHLGEYTSVVLIVPLVLAASLLQTAGYAIAGGWKYLFGPSADISLPLAKLGLVAQLFLYAVVYASIRGFRKALHKYQGIE